MGCFWKWGMPYKKKGETYETPFVAYIYIYMYIYIYIHTHTHTTFWDKLTRSFFAECKSFVQRWTLCSKSNWAWAWLCQLWPRFLEVLPSGSFEKAKENCTEILMNYFSIFLGVAINLSSFVIPWIASLFSHLCGSSGPAFDADDDKREWRVMDAACWACPCHGVPGVSETGVYLQRQGNAVASGVAWPFKWRMAWGTICQSVWRLFFSTCHG